MYLRTEGIILKRRNFGEADRIVTIFTRDFGKITVLAKGVRRPRSKKAGHLELGSWCKVFVAKGKSLDLLTEVQTRYAFGIDNFSEEKTNKIYHILEIVENIFPEHQKNLIAYNLLVKFLKRIEQNDDFNLLSTVFKIKLMSNLGYFTSHTLKESNTKNILRSLENEDLEVIKDTISLSERSYLKLLTFLDSMIERTIQQKLKTSRFL